MIKKICKCLLVFKTIEYQIESNLDLFAYFMYRDKKGLHSMKKLMRVSASQEINNVETIQFSVEDILWLLRNIEELKTCAVSFSVTVDNRAEFTVGDYAYSIPAK